MGIKEDVVKHDLRHVLRKLEELQDRQIQKTLEPKKPEIAIGDEDRAAALDLLKDRTCSTASWPTSSAAAWWARRPTSWWATSPPCRGSLEAPLAVIVQSSSAAGKSSLMEAILAFVPEEQRVEYSAMTGQSLFYMGEQDLKHKVLAIVEEEGASARRLRAEAAAERRRADHRIHRQGPGHRPPGHASIPRRRTGDDLPHHHRHRPGRRAAQPLPGADGERRPRADAGHPPAAARGSRPWKACWHGRSARRF